MIGVLAPQIDRGELQIFCPDAVEPESWYKSVHPGVRVMRHLQYERYMLHEVVPFIRWKNQTPRLAVTGCSFGAPRCKFCPQPSRCGHSLREHERRI